MPWQLATKAVKKKSMKKKDVRNKNTTMKKKGLKNNSTTMKKAKNMKKVKKRRRSQKCIQENGGWRLEIMAWVRMDYD